MIAVRRPPSAQELRLAAAEVADVPEHDGWLTSTELLWLSSRRVAKRRADWRLGRWVAKQAAAAAAGAAELHPSYVEILAAAGGAPGVRFHAAGAWPSVSLSLSHSGGVGFAVASPGEAALGCDLEALAPHSDAFVRDYFTGPETSWILAGGRSSDARATLLWSAKESALKALGEGLRLDTRSVEVLDPVEPDPDGSWRDVTIAGPGERRFEGWWRTTPDFVWTVALRRR